MTPVLREGPEAEVAFTEALALVSEAGVAAREGPQQGCGAHGGKAEDKEWLPVTELDLSQRQEDQVSGRDLFSLPIKESAIIDFFPWAGGGERPLKVLKIMPVQKQTRAGHQTRFKAFVPIRDYNGHVGLGVKCSKEVATAIRGAIFWPNSPLSRAYWGNKIGKPRTLPCKVTGCCGSMLVLVCLTPAPRGTGIVSTPVPKKLLMMAGIEDCYTSARGCTATLGNLAKATLDAISKMYNYLTPDL